MARLIISDDVRVGGSFAPGQIFAVGSIVLHADPTGHPGRIGSLAPDQEIRFGNLEFSVDSRGDLPFAGLVVSSDEPEVSEALTSDLPLGSALWSIPADDLVLSPDPVTVPEG